MASGLRFEGSESGWLSRSNPREYMRLMATPVNPQGVCHCDGYKASARNGVRSVLLFSEMGISAKTGQPKILGYHCILCPDDCTFKRTTKGLLDGPFPDFEDWQAENGGAALRAAGKATVWTVYATYARRKA